MWKWPHDPALTSLNHGLRSSPGHLGTQQEPCLPVPQGAGPSSPGLMVDPKPASWLRFSPTQLWSQRQLPQPGDPAGYSYLLKPICKNWKGWLLLQMHRHWCSATRIVKYQANMIVLKEINKALVIAPKEMEIHKLLDKEFKIIILKLNELQQKTDN